MNPPLTGARLEKGAVLRRAQVERLGANQRQTYADAVMNALECVDSTVAPRAVLDVVSGAYAIGSPATCELIQRHLDATYLVAAATTCHVVRLFNARWWSRQEVEGEVSVLRHLKARGIPVAGVVQRNDGGWLTTVLAPEGERQLLVYEYVQGEPLLPSRDAGKLGELAGRMHRALDDCVLAQRRRELTPRALLDDTFDAMISQLSDENAHRRYLEGLRARVMARAKDVGLESFRVGLCHGDLNFSNGLRLPDGQIALYDFEQCGVGLLAYDLGVFRWTQRLVGAPEQTWLDFIAGYRRENELPERELAGMELLVLLRQAYMLGHDAQRSRIESLGTRWKRARRSPGMDTLRRLDAELFGTKADLDW